MPHEIARTNFDGAGNECRIIRPGSSGRNGTAAARLVPKSAVRHVSDTTETGAMLDLKLFVGTVR